MKVYLTPPQPSRGLQRIADALVKYKPEWVEVAGTQAEAELVVIYAIGRRDGLLSEVSDYIRANKQYAVIQICLRSTQKPTTGDWFDIWYRAKVVWSYYDLNRLVYEDGGSWKLYNDHFYHAPLGVESDVFHPWGTQKTVTIAMSGLSRLSESIRECVLAVEKVEGRGFHVGPFLRLGWRVTHSNGMSDDGLAMCLSQCEFVSALRRKEGFELPAAEGLLCGARPIAFDTPDYRWIYKSWAEYIHEGTRQEVVDQLIELFRRGARPVTQGEINEARQWFHWPTIVGGFYERLR